MENKNKNKLYLIIMFTLVLIILDQLLKFYIPNVIHEQSIPIIENILQFTYKQNTGGAFSFGQNNLISIVIINIIILGIVTRFMVSQIEKTDNLTTITLCFVLAGGIGNLLDRVFRGFVIDYIDITLLFPSPIFNLADIYIVCGWLILVLLTIKNFLGEAKQKSYQN